MTTEIFDEDYVEDAKFWIADFLVRQYAHYNNGLPFHVRMLDNERYVMLHPLMHHNTITTGHLFDEFNASLDRYCYPDHQSGLPEVEAWDGNSQLDGWAKHHPTSTYILCGRDMTTSVNGLPCSPEEAMEHVNAWRTRKNELDSERFHQGYSRAERNQVRERVQRERLLADGGPKPF